jgi:hypothetical protein
LNPRDVASLVDEWRKHRFSLFIGVNTLLNALLDFEPFHDLDFSGLVYTCGAGAAVQPAVTDRGHTVGVPVSSTELRLIDDEGHDVQPGMPGEIVVRGPQVMREYWNRPDETQATFTPDGFLRTGDVAVVDPQGYVTIVGRKKDVILVSGFNVYHPVALDVQKVDFVADEAYEVTPLVQGFADVLNKVAANGYDAWEVGKPQSVFGKAFAPFGLAEGKSFMEYDLVYLNGDMLFWGARHVDGRGSVVRSFRAGGVDPVGVLARRAQGQTS